MSRQDFDFYPFHTEIATRYADLDTQKHINNVRVAELYQESRVKFIRSSFETERVLKYRKVLADIHIAYRGELHFGDPVAFGVGVERVGNSSLVIVSAAFQGGQCMSTSEAVLVFLDDDGKPKTIPDKVREDVKPFMVTL